MWWDMEEVARLALERANVGSPVDPELVAKSEGLEIHHAETEGALVGRRIFVDYRLRRERRAFAIAHEIGHWLMRETPFARSERAANYIASALLLPRPDVEADFRRFGWDLIAICARHRWASFEAAARRIVALREARAIVFDHPLAEQRPPSFYSVPGGSTPTDEERIAAREARLCGAPVELRPGLTAWPVLEHDWHRVITVQNV